MKYKLNESQLTLIKDLKKNRAIKEQEFIMQSFSPQQIGEVQAGDSKLANFEVDVTILTSLDDPREANALNNEAFLQKAMEEIKSQLNVIAKEFFITSIQSSGRGVQATVASNGIISVEPMKRA